MQKLNKNGLFVKRVVGNDFSVGNAVVEGVRTSEELAILNLTKEQMDILSYIVNSEGRNIPINEDGTFDTKIGHSYSVRYTDDLRLEEGYSTEEENFVIEKIGDGQLLFFAISEQCKINNPSYVVTEVFRLAALKDFVDWSGEGEPKWVKRLRAQLTALIDGSEFVLEWLPLENELVLHTDRLDDNMLESANSLLERVVPKNIEVVRKNYILPAGYKEIEYIEYTGTQRLAFPKTCGIGFTQEIVFEVTSQMPTSGDTNARCLIGANYSIWWAIYGAYDGISVALTNAGNYERNKKYKWIYCVPDNKTQTMENNNGLYTYTHPSEFLNETSLTDWYIPFTATNAMLWAKLYSLNISTPIHGVNMKMIPCLDEVGAPCMFDTVNYQTYYNTTTGDFLYPAETSIYSFHRVLPDWGQLTAHGLRRLYHTPEGYAGELHDYALENDYKPIIESEMPEDGYWTPQWRETKDEIVLEWVEAEPPMDLED